MKNNLIIFIIFLYIINTSHQKTNQFLEDFDVLSGNKDSLFKLYTNTEDSKFEKEVSIWGIKISRARQKEGYKFFGPVISDKKWVRPVHESYMIKPKPGNDHLWSEPIGHIRVWEYYTTFKAIILQPVCQEGHLPTSAVVEVSWWPGSYTKKWGKGVCIDKKYFVRGRQYKIWEDKGYNKKEQLGIWSFYQNHSSMKVYDKYFLD